MLLKGSPASPSVIDEGVAAAAAGEDNTARRRIGGGTADTLGSGFGMSLRVSDKNVF